MLLALHYMRYGTNGKAKSNNFQCKVVFIFLLIISTYVLRAQKNLLIETLLLSTHNIRFD